MAGLKGSSPNNLPHQLTSFIGREREIVKIKRLLAGTRLVTLTGAGGCGKTRLAQEVGAGLLERFSDGVWWVEMAALAEPELVPQAVASVLDVSERPGRPLVETLVDHLRPKSPLLLLDNCEHLLPACAYLADTLLRSCPHLRILATSREALGVSGETKWLVPSLSLPERDPIPAIEHLSRYEAVRLFYERARAAEPNFTLTNENASAVIEVCRRVDGIPLAIELAAARVHALAIEQIAVRLDDRLRLLTGGSRTAPGRHQTLRAAMDWSFRLLSEKERILLSRLSIFAGGWTLEAAESVCSGADVPPTEVLDLLIQLVNKSLAVAEAQRGAARYRLLETVRQYAWERLRELGTADEIRTRHRDWYIEFAESADANLNTPEQLAWLEQLEAEHDNLRAALQWSKEDPGGAEAELRLAGALTWFWDRHGHWNEARGWLEGALERSGDAPRTVLPKVLLGVAYWAWRQGDYGRAAAVQEQGLALSRDLRDENVAWFVFQMGNLAADQGDYDRAVALYEECLALRRALGDKWGAGMTLAQLGDVARLQRDSERATALYAESLALARETGERFLIAFSLRNLGLVALQQGNHGKAEPLLTESLALCKEVKDKWVTGPCLEGLAQVALERGNYSEATRLLAATEVLYEALGRHRSVVEQTAHDQYIDQARGSMPAAAFAAIWAEGRALTPSDAIEFVLTARRAISERATRTVKLEARKPAGLLAPREQEVATLVARGLTNHEIASLLVITERTAETHVQHILNKLGFNSRAQIAAWAVENGLHTVSPR
jgi:predicted ATPase/DNA-binding NarL/FixJ family response regulator